MITYFYWWYFEEPVYILRAIKVITKKIFLSFSVPVLLRTLFDPWKRDAAYVENASLQELFNIWLNNLISRLVGFVVRLMTIFAGILITIIVFVLLAALFIIWLFLPVIIILLVGNGIRGVLNG